MPTEALMRSRRLATLAASIGLSLALPIGSAHGGDAPAVADAPVDFTLANGLHVHLRPIPSATKVALVTLFGIGELHDFPEPCGTAHLVEHVFVTAAAGSTPSRTVEDVAKRYPDGWNAQT